MADEQTAAVLTIKNAGEMTVAGRRSIADWLRKQAKFLEDEGAEYSARFRARYMFRTMKR